MTTNPTLPELEQRVEEAERKLSDALNSIPLKLTEILLLRQCVTSVSTAVEALATARERERIKNSNCPRCAVGDWCTPA